MSCWMGLSWRLSSVLSASEDASATTSRLESPGAAVLLSALILEQSQSNSGRLAGVHVVAIAIIIAASCLAHTSARARSAQGTGMRDGVHTSIVGERGPASSWATRRGAVSSRWASASSERQDLRQRLQQPEQLGVARATVQLHRMHGCVPQSAVASAASGECVSGQGLAAPKSQRRNAFSMGKGYTGSEQRRNYLPGAAHAPALAGIVAPCRARSGLCFWRCPP